MRFDRAGLVRAVTAVLLSIPTVAIAQTAVEPAGHWVGAIEIPGRELKIDVDLARRDGAWIGDISIPAQGATDLDLIGVSIDGPRVRFVITEVPGEPTFVGTLDDDGQRITGTFTQGGATLTFRLERAEPRAALAREALEGFDAFLEDSLSTWRTPGLAMAIVVEDEVVFAEGLGYRDVADELPVTTRTLFAIGSCSKAFTTFVMATLVDEGQLDWDRPVVEYVPDFRLYDEYATAHVTPRDLVTHRTGLPRHDLVWYNSPLTRDELLTRLRYLEPSKDLRETFQYNNLMFMTAGVLVERLAGTTWEEAVRARVFSPLGMTYSNFSVADSQEASDSALPYQWRDDETRRMPYRRIDSVGPAGSINSNIQDMILWVMAQLGRDAGGELVQPATLREMHTPQMAIATYPQEAEVSTPAYALGWMVNTYRGHYRVQHGGGIDGFTALVTLFPRDGIGIVALANRSGTPLPALATSHAADRLLGLEERDWSGEALARRDQAEAAADAAEERKSELRKPGTRPAHPLETYVGTYRHDGYGPMEVALEDARLVVSYNGISTPFEHWHFEVFNGLEHPDDQTLEDMRIRFLTNMKGDVAGLAAQLEPAVDEIVFDRQAAARMSEPEYLTRFVGRYRLAGQVVTVGLKGGALTLTVPGQPQYELKPDRDDEFDLEGVAGYSVRFVERDGTLVARINQPNGVFEATRLADPADE